MKFKQPACVVTKMENVVRVAAVAMVLSLGLLVEPVAAACPVDSVQSGTVCMDTYEASVWLVAPAERTLIGKIQKGTATLANLQSAGAVQLGLASGDLAANGCPETGNGCLDVYAVSLPGVTPSVFITWFQAAAAARNSGKRLPTNQEWQVAALGTPDPGAADDGSTTCHTVYSIPITVPTGSRSGCRSDVGAFDMVGNIGEWVADWSDQATGCTNFPASFGSDQSCVGGDGTYHLPGALFRGGYSSGGANAGVFAVDAGVYPSFGGSPVLGFRCAR